ncbi:hypothetical protein, partial [Bacillus paralicheniformis]|uniref:hypothetical protein n=1 Tax=Bacillus paralicheniformis TaxID=1648923 RepID=UPI0020BFC9C3
PDIQYPVDLNISKQVRVIANLDADITRNQHYYYAVLSKNQGDLTIANIKDIIETADSSNYTISSGGGII